MRNPEATRTHIHFSFGVSEDYPDGLLGHADCEALLTPTNVTELTEIINRMNKENKD